MPFSCPENTTVTSIAQTRDGYLWIATYGGLARFDGVEFRVFDIASHPGLVSNRLTALYEDSRGGLWTGHESGGLSRYCDGRFIPYGQEVGLPPGPVWTIVEDRSLGGITSLLLDRQGVLWVGTAAGLARSVGPGSTEFTLVDTNLPGRGKRRDDAPADRRGNRRSAGWPGQQVVRR